MKFPVDSCTSLHFLICIFLYYHEIILIVNEVYAFLCFYAIHLWRKYTSFHFFTCTNVLCLFRSILMITICLHPKKWNLSFSSMQLNIFQGNSGWFSFYKLYFFLFRSISYHRYHTFHRKNIFKFSVSIWYTLYLFISTVLIVSSLFFALPFLFWVQLTDVDLREFQSVHFNFLFIHFPLTGCFSMLLVLFLVICFYEIFSTYVWKHF